MEWACNACTFFNKGGYLVCEICSAQRPNPLAAAIGGATASAADSTTAAPKGKRKRGTYLDPDDSDHDTVRGTSRGKTDAGGAPPFDGKGPDTAGPGTIANEITLSIRGPAGSKRVKISSIASLEQLRTEIQLMFNIADNEFEVSNNGVKYRIAGPVQIHALGIVHGTRLQVNHPMPTATPAVANM